MAMDRLRGLLGFSIEGPAFAIAAAADTPGCGPLPDLLREALVARPDVRAAELAVEAAGARLGWERARILTLTAVLDANGSGSEGFEAGPGLDLGLPLADRNQAGRARAAAELERASRAYVAAQQRVAANCGSPRPSTTRRATRRPPGATRSSRRSPRILRRPSGPTPPARRRTCLCSRTHGA
jgi:outer membrane protein TolC